MLPYRKYAETRHLLAFHIVLLPCNLPPHYWGFAGRLSSGWSPPMKASRTLEQLRLQLRRWLPYCPATWKWTPLSGLRRVWSQAVLVSAPRAPACWRHQYILKRKRGRTSFIQDGHGARKLDKRGRVAPINRCTRVPRRELFCGVSSFYVPGPEPLHACVRKGVSPRAES